MVGSGWRKLAKIALKKGDYAVIDYTLAIAPDIHEGNYSIDKKWREIMEKL